MSDYQPRPSGFAESPIDGTHYGRVDGGWGRVIQSNPVAEAIFLDSGLSASLDFNVSGVGWIAADQLAIPGPTFAGRSQQISMSPYAGIQGVNIYGALRGSTVFDALGNLYLISFRMPGFTGEETPWQATLPIVSLSNCGMDSIELNAFFTSLGTTNLPRVITVSGATGAGGCSPSIATAKGWVVFS